MRVKIEVTQEMLDTCIRRNSARCILATAFANVVSNDYTVSVSTTWNFNKQEETHDKVFLLHKDRSIPCEIQLPRKLAKLANAWEMQESEHVAIPYMDANAKVEPTTCMVNIPGIFLKEEVLKHATKS